MSRLSVCTFAISVLLLAGCSADRAQIPAQVAALQEQSLNDDTPWRLLESLTTEVGPRMAGTEGDRLGVEWAVRTMRELGFDRVWTEPVDFPLWVRRSESAAVVTPRRQSLAVTAIGRSPSTGGPLQAAVVAFDDLEQLQQAAPEAVRGRIVFLTERMERTRSGRGYGKTVAGRALGPFVAAEKGALALLIRSVGTDDDRLPHTGNMSGSTDGQPVPSGALSNPDADLLEAMLKRGPVTVELDLDCGFDGMGISRNVIGEFDGRENSDRFVLIGAHLDSWDLGTGAVDDGAGVAITLAAAKRVADAPQRPRHGTRVVLYANEEQGIFGALAYVDVHRGELERHILGSESDLGSGRIYGFSSRVAEAAKPEMERLESWLAPLGIPWQQDRTAFGGADVGQMGGIGMPVIDLNQDASLYFDLHHTANDTLDKVDPADLRFNVAAWSTLVWFVAESNVAFGPVQPRN